MSFSGYVLNGEQAGFYYMSLSRLHPQRIRETKRLSESTASPPQHPAATTISCSAAAQAETPTLESEAEAQADSEVRYINDRDVQRREKYMISAFICPAVDSVCFYKLLDISIYP